MNTIHTHLVAVSLAGLFGISTAMAEETKPQPGQAETEMRCLICHGDTQAGQQRLAPPMVMVKRHYQSLSQEEFEKAVLAWVAKPDAKKSKMPGAIRRFNLMPALPMPEAELKLIAQYIHKTDFAFPGNCGPGQGGSKKSKAGQGCCDEGCGEKKCGTGQGCGKNKAKKGTAPQVDANCGENC